MASKPKYDLKASDRNRNRLLQIGLTAIVAIFAVMLVMDIVLSADEKPTAGQADPIPPDLVVSPELLGGAATVGVRGIIFLDAEYYAEVEVFRCGSAQCRAGVDNVTEALAEKFG